MIKKYSEPYNISLSMMHSPDSIPLYLDENHPNFSKYLKISIEAWVHFYGNVAANGLKKK